MATLLARIGFLNLLLSRLVMRLRAFGFNPHDIGFEAIDQAISAFSIRPFCDQRHTVDLLTSA